MNDWVNLQMSEGKTDRLSSSVYHFCKVLLTRQKLWAENLGLLNRWQPLTLLVHSLQRLYVHRHDARDHLEGERLFMRVAWGG